MTLADEIREMLAKGATTTEIREELGCSRQDIHAVKHRRAVMGRPRKHVVCTHCGGTGHEPTASADAPCSPSS